MDFGKVHFYLFFRPITVKYAKHGQYCPQLTLKKTTTEIKKTHICSLTVILKKLYRESVYCLHGCLCDIHIAHIHTVIMIR